MGETDGRSEAPRALSVALSGGGHRATVFGLGALLFLADRGLNERVRTVASVSGGSIANAHLTIGSAPFDRVERRQFAHDTALLAREVAGRPRLVWIGRVLVIAAAALTMLFFDGEVRLPADRSVAQFVALGIGALFVAAVVGWSFLKFPTPQWQKAIVEGTGWSTMWFVWLLVAVALLWPLTLDAAVHRDGVGEWAAALFTAVVIPGFVASVAAVESRGTFWSYWGTWLFLAALVAGIVGFVALLLSDEWQVEPWRDGFVTALVVIAAVAFVVRAWRAGLYRWADYTWALAVEAAVHVVVFGGAIALLVWGNATVRQVTGVAVLVVVLAELVALRNLVATRSFAAALKRFQRRAEQPDTVGGLVDDLRHLRTDAPRLSDVPLDVLHLFCTTELNSGRQTFISQRFVFNTSLGVGLTAGYGRGRPLPLHTAVQVSSNLPGAFPVRVISRTDRGFHRDLDPDLQIRDPGHVNPWVQSQFALTDGGVYNNMADDWEIQLDRRITDLRAGLAAHADVLGDDVAAFDRLLPRAPGDRESTAYDHRSEPNALVVVDSSGLATPKRKVLLGVPGLGEIFSLTSVIGVLYDRTNANRQREIYAKLRNEDQFLGTVVRIDRPPTWLPDQIVRAPWADFAQRERAARALEALGVAGAGDSQRFADQRHEWDRLTRACRTCQTTFDPLGIDRIVELLYVGYVTTMINLYVMLPDAPDPHVPPYEAFQALAEGRTEQWLAWSRPTTETGPGLADY